MQNCKTANRSMEGANVWSITWFIDLLSMRCSRWLLPFRRDSRWNPSHVVVGGWWWDCSYKGAHVTIKTISLDSVLRLICRSCVPLYHGRGEREEQKSEVRKYFAKFSRVFVGESSQATRADSRRSEVSIKASSSADHICVTLGKRAKSFSCNFARS